MDRYQDIDLLASRPRLVPWADIACRLGDVPEAVREELRRVTLPERHFARVHTAFQAAADWLQARGFDYNLNLSLVVCARAICFLEGLGLHGGGFRSPGAGTTRHEAFAGLGKGRRQASDGPAWTAAIAEAAGSCYWGLSGDPDGGGDLGIWVYPRRHDHISPPPADHFVPWSVVRGWLADDERRVALRHAARALYGRRDTPSALAAVAKAMAAEEPESAEVPASEE